MNDKMTLDELIKHHDQEHHGPQGSHYSDDACAELAAIRSTVAEQARQLSEARRAMWDVDDKTMKEKGMSLADSLRAAKDAMRDDETCWIKWCDEQAKLIDAWLASTAPAQPGHPLNCAWDNVASDDFDGCNGCAFCCATGDTPPAQPDAPAVTLDLRDSEMP